jgi:hypothetical protein
MPYVKIKVDIEESIVNAPLCVQSKNTNNAKSCVHRQSTIQRQL